MTEHKTFSNNLKNILDWEDLKLINSAASKSPIETVDIQATEFSYFYGRGVVEEKIKKDGLYKNDNLSMKGTRVNSVLIFPVCWVIHILSAHTNYTILQ